MLIVLMRLEMFNKLIDAGRQQRDLHFGRTGVIRVDVIGLNYFPFLFFTERHDVLLTLCRATGRGNSARAPSQSYELYHKRGKGAKIGSLLLFLLSQSLLRATIKCPCSVFYMLCNGGTVVRFDIFTLFPEMFSGVFDASIIRRAREAEQVTIALHNIRDYATDRHHMTDDTPYGGGGGMVMKPEPIWSAVESVLGFEPTGQPDGPPIILLTPQGRLFTQAVAHELSEHKRLLLVCGRYEGVDERVRQYLVTDEVSIGDYVLSGGEIPAMVVVDAIVRLLPGVLGDPGATANDSYASGLLEYPHYTRPAVYRGHPVPDVLLSGHHAEVDRWRRREALHRTRNRRPDLLARADLSQADREFLAQLEAEGE